jgi:lycopene cyclase domain-containing protein
MFGHPTYLIWLILFIGLPLLAQAIIARRALWRRRHALVWLLAGALAGGWAWDALAVRLGAWYYDPNNILNIWIGGLPIEEWIWIAGVTLLFGCITVIFVERMRECGGVGG